MTRSTSSPGTTGEADPAPEETEAELAVDPGPPRLRDTVTRLLMPPVVRATTPPVPSRRNDDRVTFYRDLNGEWRWTVRSPSGAAIADSASGSRTWGAVQEQTTLTIDALLRADDLRGVEDAVAIWLSQQEPEVVESMLEHARRRRSRARRPASRPRNSG